MFWILIGIICFLFILYEIALRWKYHSLNRFPGPLNLPFIGSIYYYFYFKNPEMIEFFLRSPKFVDKSDHYLHLAPWLGKNGLFISERKQWQESRKIFTPLLHVSKLDEYVKTFHSHCKVFIEVLSEVADSSAVNIYPKVSSYTFDIIAEIALAIQTNCQRNSNKELLAAMHFLGHMLMDRSLSLWKRFDFLYRFSSNYKKREKYLKLVFDIANKVIENGRKTLSEKISGSNSDGSKKNSVFIDILLKSTINGKPFPDDVIKTEVNSIIAGGYETEASTISIMIYAIAYYKEVQNKMVEELKDIFGDDRDRPATMEDLGNMRYIELVIKETLRFYSVVPFIARKLTEDVDYKGTIIPEGTNLIIFMHGVHGSSAYDKPNEFIPERFLPTNYIRPYTFIPFSAGPRNCLGQKYAMLELKVTFSNLLRQFEFESAGPDYKMDLEPDILLKPVNGIYVNIKPRVF